MKKLRNVLFIIDGLVILFFFIMYGPISFFRDLFITSAMTTMNHKYLAYVLYSEERINMVLDNNVFIEPDDDTDLSKIDIVDTKNSLYENDYERQILERDEGNDIYKVINISGKGYKGYIIAIYNPEDVRLVFAKNYGNGGRYLSDLAIDNDALVAMNASGVSSFGGKNMITGTAIVDGKIYDKGRKIVKGGGFVGFTKDNVLMLSRKSAEEVIKDGMDRAVQFGPFLIVNGVSATFKGNGGWGIASRSAIGQRKDGIVLLVVVDGRQAGSIGISMIELLRIFERYKAYNASNLDGGGSSAIYARSDFNKKSSGKILNNPVGYGYSGERKLPNALMVLPH